MSFTLLTYALASCLLILGLTWHMRSPRGLAAGLCRAAWTLPVLLSFFPRSTSEELPSTLVTRPLHVFLDDSESMRAHSDHVAILERALHERCQTLGCRADITRLSTLDKGPRGFTPLVPAMEQWLPPLGHDPWVLITDGGDSHPETPWPRSLENTGRASIERDAPRGLILGVGSPAPDELWLETAEVAPFAFESKPLAVRATVAREGERLPATRFQLQARSRENVLAATEAVFAAGEKTLSVELTIPPLPRGQHLLTLYVLPSADERVLWDNRKDRPLEVMPNTVGVLHLLGSPSWDGRFMRRYLKSEPKYDLISFFILRDPWDSQIVNERELSLIPFPVERLFKEELSHFRVVILQNFGLHQFLQPEYQDNLVRFVNEGGALLFIGGPRSMTSRDIGESPLRAILPFDLPSSTTPSTTSAITPTFDASQTFQLEPSELSPRQRGLTTLLDEWGPILPALLETRGLRGLHHTASLGFRESEAVPLLNARLSGGSSQPLVVASTPGKGRALWIFSDAFWRLGFAPQQEVPRETHTRFFDTAMTWLLRQELRKPLNLREFQLASGRFSALLRGSAAGTIGQPAANDTSSSWELRVCGTAIPFETVTIERRAVDQTAISGPLPRALEGGERCDLDLSGSPQAFGKIQVSSATVVPSVLPDEALGPSPLRLRELAQLTGATLESQAKSHMAGLDKWLASWAQDPGLSAPKRFRVSDDHFWMLRQPWFWWILLLLPVEVLLRRWPELTRGRWRE